MNLLRYLSSALLMTAAAVGAAELPGPFTARYSVSSNGNALGVMTRTFTTTSGSRYLFQSELTATSGLYALFKVQATEKSVWTMHGGEVRPLEYLYRQTGIKKREVSITFDWNHGTIRSTAKNQTRDTEITAGVLDKLLYQLLLMRDLGAAKEPLEYVVADGGKIKTYHIERLGEETLETPLGPLKTIKIRHQKAGSERSTTLWCARSLHYLPVRLDHIEKDGEETSALIQAVSGLEPP